MARVRLLSIQRFRSIRELTWKPAPGINCLIGPGDSGKTTILDALELVLTPRRAFSFTDADFYLLDTTVPIVIDVTVGDLPDELKSNDAYGAALRGFDADTGFVDDEPGVELEPVLTLRLRVDKGLEGEWSLVSERWEGRGLRWEDRRRLAALRIGEAVDGQLAWRQGSVFNRLGGADEGLTAALAETARTARDSFGDNAQPMLAEAIGAVNAAAQDLGVDIGASARALLDPASVTISGGAISLHAGNGTPLRALGTGSMRLLVAGLQRRASAGSAMVMVDEVEHGLEPHRILRFLGELRSSDQGPAPQCFLTTHSPVVLRELEAAELTVVRPGEQHQVMALPGTEELQGTLRRHPEAFLAKRIVVCEGLTEVGFVRGIDDFRIAAEEQSMLAKATSSVDAGGVGEVYARAVELRALGFDTIVLRDDDKSPVPDDLAAYEALGGISCIWHAGRAIEDELFMEAPWPRLSELLSIARERLGDEVVDTHITSASDGDLDLVSMIAVLEGDVEDESARKVLARAAKTKKTGWFKRHAPARSVARDVVMPSRDEWPGGFAERLNVLLTWLDA